MPVKPKNEFDRLKSEVRTNAASESLFCFFSFGSIGWRIKKVSNIREVVKPYLPQFVRKALVEAGFVSAPPYETIALHDYNVMADANSRPRLTLIVPTIDPKNAFGAIPTAIEIFFALGSRLDADLRVIVDEYEPHRKASVIDIIGKTFGQEGKTVEVSLRTQAIPEIFVRRNEIFIAFSWWTFLNIISIKQRQRILFGHSVQSILYLIQDYEPHFYPFSSTHMRAMSIFTSGAPYWGVFNSHELFEYFRAQGHHCERTYVFEPQISADLRPFLKGDATDKSRRILVYGRRYVPRNCFPAIEDGLRLWARRHPEFSDWEVLSAGIWHAPIPLAPGRALRSLGKLSLPEYAQTLRGAAVGISLMASPHPSYPPLEMAHFGVRTITNRYANKDLASSHENIMSIDDIAPETIADALASACQQFIADPMAGWRAKSHRPSFISNEPFPFIEELAGDLRGMWGSDAPTNESP